MTKKSILYDGDMGGDDLWAIAMVLANHKRFDILGISTVFGNVSQPMATRNVQNFLHWLGRDDLEVVQGLNTPRDGMHPFGDDAYGSDGVGGYILPESPGKIENVDIADWYAAKLDAASSPVTILSTGPATNLTAFAQKYPDKIDKIAEIIFMGGALNPPGKDGKPFIMENGTQRIGNITPFAEFNAYQDPKALNILLAAGAPMTFMSADATQHMVLTPERQERIKALHETYGPAFHQMLMAVEELDRTKFGVNGPFIHDPNVVIYALSPELYQSAPSTNVAFREEDPRGSNGDFRGQAVLANSFAGATWLNGVRDGERIFEMMEDSLRTTISRAANTPAPPAG